MVITWKIGNGNVASLHLHLCFRALGYLLVIGAKVRMVFFLISSFQYRDSFRIVDDT